MLREQRTLLGLRDCHGNDRLRDVHGRGNKVHTSGNIGGERVRLRSLDGGVGIRMEQSRVLGLRYRDSTRAMQEVIPWQQYIDPHK